MGHKDPKSSSLYAKIEIESLDAIMMSADSLIRGTESVDALAIKDLEEDRQIGELLALVKEEEDLVRIKNKMTNKRSATNQEKLLDNK